MVRASRRGTEKVKGRVIMYKKWILNIYDHNFNTIYEEKFYTKKQACFIGNHSEIVGIFQYHGFNVFKESRNVIRR